VKHTQRLDYARLAEVLQDREVVDANVLHEYLDQCNADGASFPHLLVGNGTVADWDLSCIVCEVFSLPFLPVDMARPNMEALDGLDPGFLIQNGLVPLSRFGQVLTVAMPALVPADILGLLAAQTDLVILPVVGTVETNRRWLEKNLSASGVITAEKGAKGAKPSSAWGDMFDSADAAVLSDIQVLDDVPDEEDLAIEVGGADPEGELDLEFEVPEDIDGDPDLELGILDVDLDAPAAPTPTRSRKSAPLDLPPPPTFN